MNCSIKSFILVTFLIGCASAKWTALPEDKDLNEAFGSKPSSFKFSDNWKYCQKDITDLKPKPGILNHEVEFNKIFAEKAKNGGGAIRLSEGTFIISRKIQIPEKCCFLGAGMSKTIIRLRNEAKPFYPVKGLVSCSKASHVSVVGMTIDGNDDYQYKGHKYYSYGRYGVSFERCNYAWFRNVRSVRNELYGFFLRGVGNSAAYHTFVESCYADRNGVDGIKMRSVQYAGIYNSRMRDNEMRAIYINGRSGRVLLRDIETEESKYGIELAKYKGKYPEDVLMRNVHIHDAHHTGLVNKASKKLVLETVMVKNLKDEKAMCFDLKSMSQVVVNNCKCEIQGKRFATKKGGEQCNRAIVHRGVCCHIGCKTCGGKGCSKRGPKKTCCLSSVRDSKVSCAESGPPCNLD